MKKLLLISSVLVFIFFFGCCKENETSTLNQVGTWKVLRIKDYYDNDVLYLSDSISFELLLKKDGTGRRYGLNIENDIVKWELSSDNNAMEWEYEYTNFNGQVANDYETFDIILDEIDSQVWEVSFKTYLPSAGKWLDELDTWQLNRIE